MGTSRRPRPARLAEKLLQIRLGLGLSQGQMFRRLEDGRVKLHASHISEYESGKREPPLQILLGYARAAGVPVEVVIDDDYELPARLPVRSSVWMMSDRGLWKLKKGET